MTDILDQPAQAAAPSLVSTVQSSPASEPSDTHTHFVALSPRRYLVSLRHQPSETFLCNVRYAWSFKYVNNEDDDGDGPPMRSLSYIYVCYTFVDVDSDEGRGSRLPQMISCWVESFEKSGSLPGFIVCMYVVELH